MRRGASVILAATAFCRGGCRTKARNAGLGNVTSPRSAMASSQDAEANKAPCLPQSSSNIPLLGF